MFQINSDVYAVSMRHKQYFHKPRTNLSVSFKKKVYCARIILHKKLLKMRSASANNKQFKITFKEFPLTHAFYS